MSCWGLEHVQGAWFGFDPTDLLLFVVFIFLQNIIDIVASTLIKLEGKQVYYQLSHTSCQQMKALISHFSTIV